MRSDVWLEMDGVVCLSILLGPDYMSRTGVSFPDLGTFVKRHKNQLHDYMTTGPGARFSKDPVTYQSLKKSRACSLTSDEVHFVSGARFSKLPTITGPVKLFCFPF